MSIASSGGFHLRRILIVAAACGAVFVGTPVAGAGSAPSAAQMHRIVHVCDGPASMAREERAVLLLGFAKHGYVQGRNLDLVTYDFESAGGGQSSGTPGKQPGADLPYSGFLLAQMAQTRPEIILASGVRVVQGAQKSIRSTPVIFWRVTDPVGFGFVESLARPGGNFTGFSRAIDKLTVKRLELLHEMLPQARRIAFLYISDNEHHRKQAAEVRKVG